MWSTLAVALALCLIAFGGGAGLNLERMSTVEMALTLGAGLVLAVAITFSTGPRRLYGAGTAALLLLFVLLANLSIVWSVVPDLSWQFGNRLLAYSAVFAIGVVLVRAAPSLWSSLLGGVILASVAICGYALLTKVFPNHVGADYALARLEEPYGYWNATALTAAMGAIGCLWLGARRSGHGLVNALALPALGLLLVTIMLTYSRGALAVLVIGVVLWFCVTPLRIRGGVLLLIAGLGAGAVVAWVLSRPALSGDNVALNQRISEGHEFGALLTVMLILLTSVGVAMAFLAARTPPARTRRVLVGWALLSVPLIAVLVGIGALAVSHRGLWGTVSHGFNSLTSPQARVPSNDAGRLTAISSERARYWEEALDVFRAHPALGAGADAFQTARQRYRTAPLDVQQAHGYIVQTLADLGLLGLGITLALLAAWLAAAGRSTHPFNRQWRSWRWRATLAPYTPERVGMLTLGCIVVTFGIHSTVDWTWYTPGTACVALLCAGWLAGRGPLSIDEDAPALETYGSGRTPTHLWPIDLDRIRTDRVFQRRAACGLAALAACALAAWSQSQPQASAEAQSKALSLAQSNPAKAYDYARSAVSDDPLSATALFVLSDVQSSEGRTSQARETLTKAVRLQPSNPETWETLGKYDLESGHPRTALGELRAAVFLNREAVAPFAEIRYHAGLLSLQEAYIRALRAVAPSRPAS